MRVWTNGDRHVTLGAAGLHIYDGTTIRALEHLDGVYRAPAKEGWGCFAVTPSGKRVWLQAPDGSALRARTDGADEPQRFAWRVYALRALDEDQVVAVIGKGTGKAQTLAVVRGRPPKKGGKWPVEVALAKPTRAKWPKRLWTAGREPWSRRGQLGAATIDPDDLRVDVNAHGAVVADRGTGIVVLVRPGATTAAAVLRVPTRAGVALYAAATEQGVAVSVALPTGESALCVFDPAGRCLASLELWGLGPARMLDREHVLAIAREDRDAAKVIGRVLRAVDLEEVERIPFARAGSPRDLDLCISPAGPAIAVGGAGRAAVARRAGDEWAVEQLPSPDDEPAEAPARPTGYRPKRSERAPELAFPAVNKQLDAWTFSGGASAELQLWVRSAGVAAMGLRVSVGGPAVAKGLFKPEQVEVGGEQAALEGDAKKTLYSAELPTVPLPHGFAFPLDPKPSNAEAREAGMALLATSHLQVTVRGRAVQVGEALLAVQVAAVEQSTPMKWMRPFTVVGAKGTR